MAFSTSTSRTQYTHQPTLECRDFKESSPILILYYTVQEFVFGCIRYFNQISSGLCVCVRGTDTLYAAICVRAGVCRNCIVCFQRRYIFTRGQTYRDFRCRCGPANRRYCDNRVPGARVDASQHLRVCVCVSGIQ